MATPGMLIMSNMAPGSLEQYTVYVKKAEERRLRNFLVTESFTDSLALAQHLAAVTSHIQVGTGITNLYLRNPLIAALHAMTIDRLAPGRLLLGLGTSHVPLNSMFGIDMAKPLTALREYVTAVRNIFDGKDEAAAALGLPPMQADNTIPIYLAGISPKSIHLTGELADGSLPLNYAPHGLHEVVEGIATGAQEAGRSPADVQIGLIMHCCVCADKAVALRSVRQTLSFYGRMPYYNRLFARQGFEKEAAGIMAAAEKNDMAAAAEAVSEDMAEQVAALGSRQECQQKLDEFERAGASYVILYPTAIDGDYERGVNAVLDAFSG